MYSAPTSAVRPYETTVELQRLRQRSAQTPRLLQTKWLQLLLMTISIHQRHLLYCSSTFASIDHAFPIRPYLFPRSTVIIYPTTVPFHVPHCANFPFWKLYTKCNDCQVQFGGARKAWSHHMASQKQIINPYLAYGSWNRWFCFPTTNQPTHPTRYMPWKFQIDWLIDWLIDWSLLKHVTNVHAANRSIVLP